MPIIVTGAAGFVGGHLVRRLAGLGVDVVGVDRRAAPPGSPPGVRHVVLDLAEPAAVGVLAALSAGAAGVVHLAARAGVRSDEPGIDLLRHRDVVIATDTVLAAVPPDVPLVVASSSSVYGGARTVDDRLRASREDDRLDPRGGYARAKARMEGRARRRAARGGHVLLVRPFTVVGEGQRADMALATWLAAARDGRPLPVLGGLDRRRDLVDVRAVVDALLTLLETGATGTVNLGAGRPRSLGEVVAAVERVLGVAARVSVVPAAPEEVPATFADTTRAWSLGLDLTTDLDDVVERQLRWSVDRGGDQTAVAPAATVVR